MSDSLLGDRIVLEIQNRDARKRLLQDRKLDLKRCIDICWTSERATTHPQALVGKHEVVNRVDRRSMIFLRRSVNGAIELNPRLKKKTPNHESLSESSAHSLMFWRKSYVWRGVKDTMFAGKWITGRVQKFGHGRENTLSKSRFWLFWLGLGCGLVRTLNAFVNGVALKKDKRMWGLTQSD